MIWKCTACCMPKKGEDVLVYCDDTRENFVAFSLGDGRFQFAVDKNGGAICCRPSHWAMLPESPDGKTKYEFQDLRLDHA